MEKVNLKFAKVRPEGIIPTKKDGDAGYDVYAGFSEVDITPSLLIEDIFIINPLETQLIPTGIASSCSENYYFQIQERGSTGSKGIKYGAGVIDSSYRGEWFIPITNTNSVSLCFYRGTMTKEREVRIRELYKNDFIFYPMSKAIAQFVLLPVPKTEIEEITFEELQAIPSTRGDGALGSSGK